MNRVQLGSQPMPREPADLTNEQGTRVIDELTRSIDYNPALAESDFGVDVRKSLVSMKARLSDGAFFSRKMEIALEGWGRGIAKWGDSSPRPLSQYQ